MIIHNKMKTAEKLQRKQKEFRFRRAEILAQAEKIFAENGFHKTTMAQIAGASGFSAGSLYHFFSGKEDLYSVMMTEKIDLMYEEIEKAVAREEHFQGKIRALVKSHFSFVENHGDFYHLLVGQESGLRSEGLRKLRGYILAAHRRHVDYIKELLRQGIESEILRPFDTKILATALIGIVSYFKYASIMNPSGASLSGGVDLVLDLFLRGAASGDGAAREYACDRPG